MRAAVEQATAIDEPQTPEPVGDAPLRPADAGTAGVEALRRLQSGGAGPAAGVRARAGDPLESTGSLARRGLRRPAVSPWVRGALLALGCVLIAVGIAGLVLPGIQGLLTIVAGLVVVSLASRSAHRRMRRGLRRWPRVLDAYQKMRRGLHRRFSPRR